MTDSIDNPNNEQMYLSYNNIEEPKESDHSDELASSLPAKINSSLDSDNSHLEYNKYIDNSLSRQHNRKSYYEQMKTHKDQYDTELQKGLDRKNQQVELP